MTCLAFSVYLRRISPIINLVEHNKVLLTGGGGGQGARCRDSTYDVTTPKTPGSKENKTGAPVFGRKQQQNAHFLKHLTKDFFEISFA